MSLLFYPATVLNGLYHFSLSTIETDSNTQAHAYLNVNIYHKPLKISAPVDDINNMHHKYVLWNALPQRITQSSAMGVV